MQEFPTKLSKVLVFPDPQYIPGYTGYCPQLKYHHGSTYGQLTSKLLSSPETLSSRRLVLHTGHFPSMETDTSPQDQVWRSLHGEKRSLERIIPGYTGFVPKSQNYFAGTYADMCRQALSDFARDQKSRRHLQTADWPVSARAQQEAKKLTMPLTAVSLDPVPYTSPEPWKSLGSPYSMDDHSPHKYFISGFTGYVPKSRFLIGSSYPITTNKALIQFGRQMRSAPTSLLLHSLPPIPPIYPANRGLLPSYTGHVPGYKFRYGHTFGQLTQNALGLSATQRKIEVRS